MNKTRWLGITFVVSWLAMGTLTVLWALPNMPLAILAGSPVLLLVPWLVRNRPRAQMLATMVAMVYFVAATTELVASTSRTFPSLVLAFSVLPVLILIVLNAQRRRSQLEPQQDQETSIR